MASYNTNLQDWGAVGQAPPSGYAYADGEPPVDVYDNWKANNVINDIQHLISLTNDRVESDKGTTRPSSPEPAHVFADTGSGDLEWWDASSSSWNRAVDATGDSMSGSLTVNGGLNVSSVLKANKDVKDSAANVVYDQSNKYVPQARLENNSVTVAGNTISLGDSTTIAHSDLSTVPSSAHHSRYSDSEARTAVDGSNVSIAGDADTVDGQDYADIQSWVNNNADVSNAKALGGKDAAEYQLNGIRDIDKSETFNGNYGESVSLTKANIINGNIELEDGGSSTVSNGLSINGFTNSQKTGRVIELHTETASIDASVKASGHNQAYLIDDSDGSTVASQSVSGDFTLTDNAPYPPGTYRLLIDASGSDYTISYDDGGFSSDSSEFVNLIASWNGGKDTNDSYVIDSITANVDPATSGSAVIEWASPSTFQRWDVVTFARTLDNETVTVDIEDGNGNTLKSNIGKNTDISGVSTSKNVTFQVDLARSSTSNNPTFNFAVRQLLR
jgi:hypothetical protein